MILADADLHPFVRDEEYKRLLRVPADFVLTGALADNAQWAREWYAANGRPWLWGAAVGRCAPGERTLVLDETEFPSPELARRFRHARTAVVVAASAGPEAEAEASRRWETGEPDRYYFLEAYASAIVEALLAEARARLCTWGDPRGEVVLPHYCPGYPGWPVSDQAALLGLLARHGGAPGPMEVMISGMLRPKKSQLALFGLAPATAVAGEPADLIPCKYCAQVRCEFRREPYALAS